jgi:hypothetical protein
MNVFLTTYLDLIVRQVPYYLIIGSGPLAMHFANYFGWLEKSGVTWSRSETIDLLYNYFPKLSHIFLISNKSAILSFVDQYLRPFNAYCLVQYLALLMRQELSGGASQRFSIISGKERDASIPFILDDAAPDFSLIFKRRAL